jgi:hypothetical protein
MKKTLLIFSCLLSMPIVFSQDVIPAPEADLAPKGAPFSENINSTESDVAQQLHNQAANLISVPFNFDYDADIGANDDGERMKLDIDPSIPQNISENWTIVNRTSIPLIHQSKVTEFSETQNGLGDIQYEGFLREKHSPLIAAGPMIRLPSGTSPQLTSDKWSAGPTLVFNGNSGPFGFNLYSYQLWSFAGESDRQKINESYIEPSISFTSQNAFSLNFAAEHTINNVSNANLGYGTVTASQVVRIYDQRVRFLLGYKHSYNGPEDLKYDWGLRGAITFVY